MRGRVHAISTLKGLVADLRALKVFEVDNDSPCQLLTVITDTKTMQMSAMKACFQIAECSLSYAKLRNGATECKSIHNRLQSIYNPFIIHSFRSQFIYPFSHK